MKVAPAAFRSGCYKRAVTLLQEEDGDCTSRDATAASLYRLLANANRQVAKDSRDAANAAGHSEAPATQQQTDKEPQTKDRIQVKLIKQQLRRQRQEQRQDHTRQLWQQRYEEKLKIRQQELAARIKQQDGDREEQLQKLRKQEQGLQQQLKQHRQQSASPISPLSETKSAAAAPLKKLQQLHEMKAKAEEQLAMVSYISSMSCSSWLSLLLH